ncbi:MAG: hypothetical protein QFE16_11555 [Pseudomonadota bacterium]|nr:hypothetical protein [Pseudomonadota bacterium]
MNTRRLKPAMAASMKATSLGISAAHADGLHANGSNGAALKVGARIEF